MVATRHQMIELACNGEANARIDVCREVRGDLAQEGEIATRIVEMRAQRVKLVVVGEITGVETIPSIIH
jgi:hypothetical protein